MYYPERELAAEKHNHRWYRVTIHRLIAVCPGGYGQILPGQGAVPPPQEYAYIIEELINTNEHDSSKKQVF